MPPNIDVSRFNQIKGVSNIETLFFVVKSQDQLERRKRLLAKKKGEKFGRLDKRPTAEGLLVKASLENSEVNIHWTKTFREPRHIYPLENNRLLFTEIDQVHELNGKGEILKTFTHPWFAFLHTIELSHDGSKILVASSGFDRVIELDRETGEETWQWCAWENGFNPDGEGYYLVSTRFQKEEYEAKGKAAKLIRPDDYGEQGLLTATRSAHPSMALYDPHSDQHILIGIGHSGDIYRVHREAFEHKKVIGFLSQMPHGLRPYDNGWMITETTKGNVYFFDKEFKVRKQLKLNTLPGKPEELAEHEWVQTTIPVTDNEFISVDANRGLLHYDIENEIWAKYAVNENWCIQDILITKRT